MIKRTMIKLVSLVSPALAGGFLTTVLPGKPQEGFYSMKKKTGR